MERHSKMRPAARLLAAGVAVSLVSCAARDSGHESGPPALQDILKAYQEGVQIPPPSSTHGPLTVESAYRLQAVLAGELTRTAGPLAGYKVAYASEAARKQFGMDEPARGPFFMSQRVPSGSTLPDTAFNEIMLETEVAFTIGRAIHKPIADVAELRPYVRWVHAAFDAGDFPYTTADAKPVPADMVAIGTGARFFVIGPAVDPDAVELTQVDMSLSRDGEEIRESHARDVLGDPWNSLLWCVNHLHRFGLGLEPGMVVLTGTAAPAYRARGDGVRGSYVGDCGALGRVTLTIEAR